MTRSRWYCTAALADKMHPVSHSHGLSAISKKNSSHRSSCIYNENFEPYNSHICGSSSYIWHESVCFKKFVLCEYLLMCLLLETLLSVYISQNMGCSNTLWLFSSFLRWKL